MKKFILQYLIMACTMVYAGPPFAEALAVTNAIQSSILAEWGLQYCLQYDKENLFEPIEKNKPFKLRKDVAQGRLDLQKYFDDNYYYLPNAMSTLRFRHCMDIFGFEKYRSEVERIVKKYCEDCK
ncbi:hypothetical protein BKN38_09820 [Helicobacter sp. CLO-3]|uniref:hypothetical protein n=1 Tax=unclassified Helicobacter TaxID=2593540 RepID=UPI000805A943|nr:MULTISPECIES: hypothetical protein [unclassified Helicobacter]OBV28442.1 hypothetical protein BA723_09455 [Helicobacter sp. CLO-3]OHU81051.1 hypothetical protein BKN38_09820 [Helicobacter sp. CLO-3]